MKDKTKVKPKNVWKVAYVLAKNPHATQREIQKEANLAPQTVNLALKEVKLNWNKDETIQYIVASAKSRIQRVSKLFDRFIDEIETKKTLDRADVREAKDIVKDDMARVTVLGGDITDESGGLKITKDTPDDVLDDILFAKKK